MEMEPIRLLGMQTLLIFPSLCTKSIQRQERLNIRELSSTAKILGTVACVGGAAIMAFFNGPKLLNSSRDDSWSKHLNPSTEIG